MSFVANESDWEALDACLAHLATPADGRLVYVPNTGNAGDALIATAAWQRFDRLGIRPKVVRTRELRAGDRAIYAGGGNLVPEYHDCERFLEKCLAVGVESAIVLPHTIRGHAALLGRLDARFTLFCREHPSLAWVAQTAMRAHVHFAPDLALGIDVGGLRAGCEAHGRLTWLDLISVPRQIPRYISWQRKTRAIRADESGWMTILRCDVEKSDDAPGRPDLDLSNLYGSPFRVRAEFDRISMEFLNILDRAQGIETNRLHVGIGGALLGKKVILHDNSYGKINAVFEASLQAADNIEFTSRVSAAPGW